MNIILSFVFGLFVGSFLGVVISRLRKNEKGILTGRSHCDRCKYVLQWYDLVPVFSWLSLKGKCRKCHQKISGLHPLTEILTGMVWGITAFLLGSEASFALLLWYLFIATVLWAITLYDLKYMEIPDEISLPSIVILLLISLIATFAFPEFPIPKMLNALLGAGIPLLFFGLQVVISDVFFKRDWIGGGDLRLGALMGVVLGWKIVIVALFLAYFLGAMITPSLLYLKIHKVPFGPFLALATFICLFWGNELLQLWLDISGWSQLA